MWKQNLYYGDGENIKVVFTENDFYWLEIAVWMVTIMKVSTIYLANSMPSAINKMLADICCLKLTQDIIVFGRMCKYLITTTSKLKITSGISQCTIRFQPDIR